MLRREAKTYLTWWEFYFRLEELAVVYLRGDYDRVFYAMADGLTPAHRLAQILRLSGHEALQPLPSRRGQHVSGEEPPSPGERYLVVEGNLTGADVLARPLQELLRLGPKSVDVLTTGFDHAKVAHGPGQPLPEVIVGFDHWGGLVFPWEMEAAEVLSAERGRPPARELEEHPELEALPAKGELEAEQAVVELLASRGLSGQALELCSRNQPAWAPHLPGGQCVEVQKGFEALRLVPSHSLSLVVVRGAAASWLPLLRWRELAREARRALTPEGSLVFDYLDRTHLEGPDDLVAGAEYFTPALSLRLLESVGFAHAHTLAEAGRRTFAEARLIAARA